MQKRLTPLLLKDILKINYLFYLWQQQAQHIIKTAIPSVVYYMYSFTDKIIIFFKNKIIKTYNKILIFLFMNKNRPRCALISHLVIFLIIKMVNSMLSQ